MKEITLKVKSAELLLTDGLDELFLHLEIPTAFPLASFQTSAQINTQANYGMEWCKTNFGIIPRVIDARSKDNELQTV